MTDTDRRALFTAFTGSAIGLSFGFSIGMWWSRRIPGQIYRDDHDWYVDEPVVRELQHRLQYRRERDSQAHEFLLFGRGSIRLVPAPRQLPNQSGVESRLHKDQALDLVMLDLAAHRVGRLHLLHYTPRPVPGRMVQGPDIGPPEP